MVRLVFRPYTQVKRTICTSVSLRASTRVSPGFTLLRHSSPSFGSQQICSYSNLLQANDRSMMPSACSKILTSVEQVNLYFHYASGFSHPNTRIYVRLLGPCFKTGQRKPFHQHHEHGSPWPLPVPSYSTHRTLFSTLIKRQNRRSQIRSASIQTMV